MRRGDDITPADRHLLRLNLRRDKAQRKSDCGHPALHVHPSPVRARKRELTRGGF